MTDLEDLDYGEELKRLLRSSPASAGEFLRAAGLAPASLEGFWVEVAWEVGKASLTDRPRPVDKASLEKGIRNLFRQGKGMGGVKESADTLISLWREAGGTVGDLREALMRVRIR